MRTGAIVLLTDQPDRSRALAAAVDAVIDCVTVDTKVVWSRLENVRAVLADVNLADAEVKACFRALKASSDLLGKPIIALLTRWGGELEHKEAHAHGVSLCISVKENTRAIVAAVFGKVSPESSLADMIVMREIGRAGSTLNRLMDQARVASRVHTAEIEAGVDPVLRATREGGIERWIEMVWRHDDATFQHSLLVAGLVASFTEKLGFSAADQRLLTRGAIAHDIGKAKVPSEILTKPGELDEYEKLVMRAHPILGHDILKASGETNPVVLGMTRHHHEMLDGSGYPDGLSGKEISDPVRILTVCDIYAALIERRPYKPARSSSEALQALRGLHGKLEGVLIEMFARTIESQP